MGRVTAIVDENGRIMGAQFAAKRVKDDDEETPSEQLLPMPGQRVVEMDVPDEVEQLSASDLARFFSRVEVTWPATIKIPRIDVVRREHD
jgi:hypothetical protein